MDEKLNSTFRKAVIILHPHFSIEGGAGRFVLEIGQRIASDFDVYVITLNNNSEITSEYNKINFISISNVKTSSYVYWLLLPFWYMRIFMQINLIKQV